MHAKEEKTLIVIKPDGIQRSLIGEIIQRYERIGLKLMGLKMLIPNADFVEKHYTLDPTWLQKTGEKTIASYKKRDLEPPSNDPLVISQKILDGLKKYMVAGPVIAMVWQGAHAVEIVRKVTGGTEPLSSDVGTIRGDFVLDSYQMADRDGRSVRNLIHASGSVEEAEMEIAHWFSKEELLAYKVVQEKILYDVNLDGLGE
jgi:nucleoside-diphosphate kinase